MRSLDSRRGLISVFLIPFTALLVALSPIPAGAVRVGPVPDTCQFVTLAEAIQVLGGPASQDGPNRETVRSGSRAFQESHCVYQRLDGADAVLDIFLSRSLTKRPPITVGELSHQCKAKRVQVLTGLGAGAVWSEVPCLSSNGWVKRELNLVRGRDLIRIGFGGMATITEARALAVTILTRDAAAR